MRLFFVLTVAVLLAVGCRSKKRSVKVGGGLPRSIDARLDSRYRIKYNKSKFVPPEGKSLLIVGQDKRHIQQYMALANHTPAGFTFYWAPTDPAGIDSDSVRGFEIQNGDWITSQYRNVVVQSGMWMAGVLGERYCIGVTNGEYDQTIDRFCDWAKRVAAPIYLRIGYEFDGAHNELEPKIYKALYWYIADRIRVKNGVDNVAFVWQSYAAPPYKGYKIKAWYPGDNYVDWFGVTIFQQLMGGKNRWLDNVVDMARKHRKPVMIAESSPLGGIVPDSYETWNRWFVPLFNYIKEKNIKALSYINCDWNKISQFAKLGWNDTRLNNFPIIMGLWQKEINRDCYLKSSAQLFELLGYKKKN